MYIQIMFKSYEQIILLFYSTFSRNHSLSCDINGLMSSLKVARNEFCVQIYYRTVKRKYIWTQVFLKEKEDVTVIISFTEEILCK